MYGRLSAKKGDHCGEMAVSGGLTIVPMLFHFIVSVFYCGP